MRQEFGSWWRTRTPSDVAPEGLARSFCDGLNYSVCTARSAAILMVNAHAGRRGLPRCPARSRLRSRRRSRPIPGRERLLCIGARFPHACARMRRAGIHTWHPGRPLLRARGALLFNAGLSKGRSRTSRRFTCGTADKCAAIEARPGPLRRNDLAASASSRTH